MTEALFFVYSISFFNLLTIALPIRAEYVAFIRVAQFAMDAK